MTVPTATAAQEDRGVTFMAADGTASLSGTVTMPEGGDPLALAVLLPVAGPTDRDLTLGPHRYFAAFAEALAKGGVGSLRFDDRGVGSSTGRVLETSLDDRVADACKAVEALRAAHPGTDRVGLIGMSEGGGIAALAHQRCGPTSFVILLSTPVQTGRVVIEDQMRRLLATGGLSTEHQAGVEREALRFLELVSDQSPARHRREILDILEGPYGSAVLPPYGFVPRAPDARTEFVLSPWYQSQVRYDVREAIAGLGGPVLALYGALDQVIDPDANADLLRQLAPVADIDQFPGLNHLMQEAETGSPLEYASLPTSFSARAAERVLRWLTS